MLLARERVPTSAAIERLVGLQVQLPWPPYVGLWSRVVDFRREELAALIEKCAVVRATSMRGTLHTMTAADFLRFRALLQPMLSRG